MSVLEVLGDVGATNDGSSLAIGEEIKTQKIEVFTLQNRENKLFPKSNRS